ncbi:radical SAM family heme chaperone HemW [Aequorivita viscosa]|uniref:Heme chaperone HemW n=1 Tax=Aequorivita viscosa TaxID=797419 RepID=A0A1M6L4U7_9FLAO|nr:radical SAM family heme chaperone HemW [Aequorivita viscosa]SDX23298.1 oxygen-independent coproporphyrinogen-3 oxidase [Aequorivita viscosa]SHJ66216.1 oxygen-independent coproporphyrinogen-3 oxidase [Aequorivita viscosa]
MHTSKNRSNSFGIYIHIPFCKQACHYCDFHFSTSIKKKADLVNAICEELRLRKNELTGKVKTIYFGGGTPSLLTSEELQQIITAIQTNYTISENAEITLEANPDDLIDVGLSAVEDLKPTKLAILKKAGINRLSIGIQSFFEEDLKLMNRAHNASEALNCIKEAKKHFQNISIDLIYGIPGMTKERWKKNLKLALELDVPHLSCYALTVEPKTALKKFIDKGIVPPVDEEAAKQHYEILLEVTEKAGYDNYEFSNFGKSGFESRNNTAYWEGKPYLGIGPSAHGYNGKSRSWNVANNTKYIKSIAAGELPLESEILSNEDKYNEYIMTGLRTKKGVSLNKIETEFGKEFLEYLMKQAANPLKNELLILEEESLKISKEAKFLGDGIASDLFKV